MFEPVKKYFLRKKYYKKEMMESYPFVLNFLSIDPTNRYEFYVEVLSGRPTVELYQTTEDYRLHPSFRSWLDLNGIEYFYDAKIFSYIELRFKKREGLLAVLLHFK